MITRESLCMCVCPYRYHHYTHVQIRERPDIRNNTQPEVIPYGRFDPINAWRRTVYSGARVVRQTVSPLMTSMQCFVDDSGIEGRDILDTDPTENPLFHDYYHVLIPYCSSDLWLGVETTTTSAVKPNTSKCSCFNYTTSAQSGCFNFSDSNELLFTFLGKTIYQSIINQLLTDHGLTDTNKLILAGSSAGGLGAINHAKWTCSVLNSSTKLIDSSWFIDYLNGIETVFNLISSSNPTSSDTQRLLDTIMLTDSCNETDRFGYPCCISAHCVLTQKDGSGRLQFYPDNTPTFALFSPYDIYLLAPGLATVANLEESMEEANSGNGIGGLGIVLNFLKIAGEYGGTMNNTLDVVTTQVSTLDERGRGREKEREGGWIRMDREGE